MISRHDRDIYFPMSFNEQMSCLGTEYSAEQEFEQLRNEHYERFGKVITDSIIRISGHIYHIECCFDPSIMTLVQVGLRACRTDPMINGASAVNRNGMKEI